MGSPADHLTARHGLIAVVVAALLSGCVGKTGTDVPKTQPQGTPAAPSLTATEPSLDAAVRLRIMAAAIGDYLGPQKAAAALGTITLFFGIGQIIGPGIAGILADITGSFAWSYAMGTGMVLLATLLCLRLREPE